MKFIRRLAYKAKRPFGWFDWGNLFDIPQEWHAFIEGLADGFCLSKSHYQLWDKSEGDINLLESLRKEHHYYNAGRALGFAAFILLITGMVILLIHSINPP